MQNKKKLANHLLSLNLRAALDQEVRSSVLPTLSKNTKNVSSDWILITTFLHPPSHPLINQNS